MDINSSTSIKGILTTENFYKSNGQWVRSSVQTTNPEGSFTSTFRKGAKTANFNNPKLRPSPLPYHKFSYDRTEATCMTGTFTSQSQYGKSIRTGVVSGWSSPGMCPAKDREVAIFSAMEKLRSKTKDMKINLGQVYAERDQVARLIGDTTTDLARQIRKVNRDSEKKKGHSGGQLIDWSKSPNFFKRNPISKRINRISSLFLAIQYGVRPLLSDVHGAAEALAKANLNLPPPQIIRVRRNVAYGKGVVTNIPGYSRLTTTNKGKFELKAQVTFVVDGTLSVAAGIGALNPALLAWELLPFSFVADWFFKIGAYVGSWDAFLGCSFKSGGISITDIGTVETREERFSSTDFGSATAASRRITVSREPYTDFPKPTLPPYNDNSSLEHMANGLALLASAFSGSKAK